MSVHGYTPAAIIAAYDKAAPVEYVYMAAITIIVYDSLILFHRELEYIYKGRQTLTKWIYLLIKLTGFIVFVLNFVAYVIPPQTPTVSGAPMALWFVLDTAIIKTLLVLRLRALYRNNRSVTYFLCFLTGVEFISTAYAYVLTGLNLQQFIASPAPVPGCPLKVPNNLRYFGSPTLAWAARFTCNGLELGLLLFGLHHSLKEAKNHLGNGWARIRQAAPILYVFYRDGTIFYVPVCALSMFGFVATLTNLNLEFICLNWEAWLGITYYVVGTRLILNIRQTGLKFSASMITGQELSTFVFLLGRESTTEEDVEISENLQNADVLGVSTNTSDSSGSC